MTEELGGFELLTSGSASLFKVKHCGILVPPRPRCGPSHTEPPPWIRDTKSDVVDGDVWLNWMYLIARISDVAGFMGDKKDIGDHSLAIVPLNNEDIKSKISVS